MHDLSGLSDAPVARSDFAGTTLTALRTSTRDAVLVGGGIYGLFYV